MSADHHTGTGKPVSGTGEEERRSGSPRVGEGSVPDRQRDGSNTSPTTALLRLLQLTDSSFPTGGYAFSHGIEGLHAAGLIRGEADVRDVAAAHVAETLRWQDLPAVAMAHRHAATSDLAALVGLDALLSALKPVPAFREASVRVGRRTLEAAAPLYGAPMSDRVLAAVRDGVIAGHHAVAFGTVTAGAGITAGDAVAAFGAAALGGYVAAAVRLGVFGQVAAQRVVAELEPALAAAVAAAPSVGEDDLGGYLPLIDIAGMRQPDLAARLFAS